VTGAAVVRRWRDEDATRRRRRLLGPEVHEDATEVLRVLLHPVVEDLHVFLVEEAQHPLLQLARPLAGMISTRVAFFSIASSMIERRARSMSSLRL